MPGSYLLPGVFYAIIPEESKLWVYRSLWDVV